MAVDIYLADDTGPKYLDDHQGQIPAGTSSTVAAQAGTPVKLSPREREVLYWGAQGKTKAETGIILSLSQHTIHDYIRQALRKLNAVNLPHGIYLAVIQGLLKH